LARNMLDKEAIGLREYIIRKGFYI
jgi:hypothetical protein